MSEQDKKEIREAWINATQTQNYRSLTHLFKKYYPTAYIDPECGQCLGKVINWAKKIADGQG